MTNPSTLARDGVPLPVGLQEVELTAEEAERLTAIADDPDYPTHAGRRMPDVDPHALTATPDTGVHPLWSEVLTLTARVQTLEAERRMSLFVAGYQTDDTRPLESLVSEALAQKDNRIAELEAENAYLAAVVRLADERLCRCASGLPGGVAGGPVCIWCDDTQDARVGRTIKRVAELEAELARLRQPEPPAERAYLCPYCHQPVYPYSYHEGPEACQEALRQLAARESG